MTAAEQQALLNFATQGAAPNNGQATNTTEFTSYPGCNQGGGVGPTQASVPIDVSQANKEQCGMMTLYIDRTATTASTTRMLTLGGSVAIPSDAALAREYYDFPSTTSFLFDEDIANEIGGNDYNYSPIIFLPFLDLLFIDQHFIFSRMDAKDTSGTVAGAAAFATFSGNSLFKRTLDVQGNWDTVAPKIVPVFCDPCLQNDNTRMSWVGYMPVSGHDLLGISLPAGLKTQLEFCVNKYENARNMTVCSSMA